MVRRTRTDIQTNEIYKKRLIEQNLNIPKINPVEELEYKLDDDLLKIFDRTISILMEDLKYYRYQILANLTQNGQKKAWEVQAGFWKKCIKSCWYYENYVGGKD